MGLFKDHTSEVCGAGAIHWDVVEKLLQERGVNKTKKITSDLYHELAANPDFGLLFFQEHEVQISLVQNLSSQSLSGRETASYYTSR